MEDVIVFLNYAKRVVADMGVYKDHGGDGGQSPPDFVMMKNFKHQITCITT